MPVTVLLAYFATDISSSYFDDGATVASSRGGAIKLIFNHVQRHVAEFKRLMAGKAHRKSAKFAIAVAAHSAVIARIVRSEGCWRVDHEMVKCLSTLIFLANEVANATSVVGDGSCLCDFPD